MMSGHSPADRARTPHDAFERFADPLQRAVSCLGPAKITVSPDGRTAPNEEHSWSINGVQGIVGEGGWHFLAQMSYRIYRDESRSPAQWRVHTLGYRYRLSLAGVEAFSAHWHPHGNSPVTWPHIHVRVDGIHDSIKSHLRVPRFSLESAIRWTIELGFPARNSDWRQILDECEAPFLAHRTWGDSAEAPANT